MAEQVQAETQTPGALNPHEAAQALAQQMDKEDEQASRPRDDQGKFTKTKAETEEAKPEPEAAKETVEEPVEEPAKPIWKPKLKYKGEEKEVEEAEAIELAQKGYDYTQKMQQLSKERAEWEAKSKSEQEAAQKRYQDQLEMNMQAVLKLVDQDAVNADLNKLALEDPARAVQLMARRQQIHQVMQAMAAERQRIIQQNEAQSNSAKQKALQEAIEEVQKIPGWGQEYYGRILKTAESNGYTSEEAKAITDPKVVKLLDKARQWDEYVAAKPKTVDKRVASVPKVQKPGSAEKSDAKSDKVKAGMERLNKTGSRDAAQDYVLALMEAGRLG